MSRRKQARPIRVLESEEGVGTTEVHNGPDLPSHWPPTNLGESSVSGSEDDCVSSGGLGESIRRLEDDPICEHCNAEFQSLQEALEHRKECTRRKELLGSPQSIENDDVASGDEEDEYGSILEEGVKRQEEVRRQRQDAENNNSVEDGETEGEGDTAEGELPLGFPFQLPAAAAAGHVTLEALQNTKVAVAQFVSTTMANNADNAAALQELAVLQSTLYTLQHQQMMQLNLIQQLQQQLQITRPKDGSPASPPPPSSIPLPISLPVQLTIRPQTPLPPPPPKPSRTPTPVKHEVPVTPPTTQSVPPSHSQTQTSTPKPITTSPPVQPVSLPPCSISSSFASSIITNLDPPSPNEPNTLEMLQRRAQEVLDNASQGLLANNLADELAFRKSGKGSMSPYDSKSGGRNEPFFKHRCRYCGKVFGSDSALQIHIRSHTGERPFKCNVCGSRFTTKGNLKVHFQRHTSKFPHIKMNPNPIPEHLDKYHPPLLAQMSAHQSLPPGVPPHHPHHPSQFPGSPPFPPTGLSLYRPQGPSPHDLVLPTHHSHHRPNDPLIKPMLPLPLFAPRGEQDMPENLSKPIPPSAHSSPPPPSEHSDRYKKEPPEETQPLSLSISDVTESMQRGEDRLTPKHEMEVDHNQDHERYPSPPYEDECSLDSKYSNEDLLGDPESPGMDKQEDSLQEQPENLSNKSEPTDLTPEQIQAAEIKEYIPSAGFPVSDNPFLSQPRFPNLGLKLDQDERRKDDNKTDFLDESYTDSSSPLPPYVPSFSTSLAALENQVRTVTTMASQYPKPNIIQTSEEMCNNKTFTPIPVNGDNSPGSRGMDSPSGSEGQLTPSPHHPVHLPRQQPASPSAASESNSLGALDLTPRTSGVFSGFGLLPPSSITSALSSLTSSVLTSTSFSPIGLAVGPAVRGNTTCNICFKTFACNSALEIHYRSHTKERPFKCTICDRGFSTKQHMLTHKIRDMPSHLFEQKLSHDEASNTSSDTRDLPRALSVEPSHTPIPIPPPQLPQPPPPHQNLLSMPHQPPPPLPPLNKEHPPPIKRSPPEGESVLPIPKRQPSLPKHLCHVCNKNFSSSSALQIHMRTHTGDKPFRCTICHKAFTTKGNLKVHMGTHMWTNGASRRGRRMSLDLPPLPITPKDSDFLHRRPDLFYPYLPAPFLNGMQQKLNEISVIQNVGNNMSNGLLGFGGYGSGVMSNEMKPNSPVSDKQPMSPPRHRTTPPLWDLHYERKPQHAPPDEQMDVCTSPPAPSHVAPPRGEGLAA
uniref:C2H2-type domain-containing protein n=1 Tax=Clastoptera arizonana TaxID=38151 RepID=A0A1B6EDA5_9HEMI